MDPNEIQEVRKIIESSTSKVSLRDLEKKGFRKVKVLRSNDIDELIRRAVTAVVAREGESETSRVSEELVERSRKELKQLMAATQAAEAERAEILARAETLEAQLRELQPRARRAQELEAMVKELQRRLADEQDARAKADAKANDAGLAQLEESRQKLKRAESELADLRRRLDDAEGRVVANESRARHGDEATGKLSGLRHEADELRSKVKQLETEKKLLEQLEVPKLRGRIDELEGELRVQRAAAAAAPAMPAGADMKTMFRELLQEMGGVGGGAAAADAMKREFANLQLTIADSIAKAGGRGAANDADLSAAKVSLEALFKHDAGAAVQSNINEVKFKEQTTTSDLKGKMDKLKSLRNKGGKSE